MHFSRVNKTTAAQFLASVCERQVAAKSSCSGATLRVGLVPTTRDRLSPSPIFGSSLGGCTGTGLGAGKASASLTPLFDGTTCHSGLPARCWLVMRFYLGMWLSDAGSPCPSSAVEMLGGSCGHSSLLETRGSCGIC